MGSDRNDRPGRWPDGVEIRPASQDELDAYETARQQLAQFQAPLLTGASKPNGRVFVAAFDGTGNDKDKDPDRKTNVAAIAEQIEAAEKRGLSNVSASYQKGVGTQDSDFISNVDKMGGFTYGPRMEQMYYDFCVQTRNWKIENPNAEISVAATGFSRGAVTAALFTRMVEERGIQNPEDMIVERRADGLVIGTTPTKPNLVPPGQTPQVVGLFDPVATGALDGLDVRLPPSVVSGFQINAINEYRDQFKLKQIIDPGMSADGRFLAVEVPGAHSDIGGSYLLNGVSVRSGNMMNAYLNATSDRPFLREQAVPTAPEMNVIHDSTQHMQVYTSVSAGLLGERDTVERLKPAPDALAFKLIQRVFSNTDDAEPRNEALNDSLRYRHIPVRPERQDPSLPDFFKDRPPTPTPTATRLTPLPGIGAALEDRPRTTAIDVDPYGDMQRSLRGRFQPETDDIVTLDTVTVTAPRRGIGGPGGKTKSQDQEDESQEQPAPRQDQAQTFPPGHPDYPLFLAIRAQLPDGTSDEKTAELTRLARDKWINTPEQFREVVIENDRAFLYGKTPGFYGDVSLSAAPPTLEASLQRIRETEQKQTELMEQFRAEQEQINLNPTGPVMSLGARSLNMPQAPAAVEMASAPADGGGGDGGGGGG